MKLLPVKKIFRVYGNVCVRGQEVLHKKKGRLQASAAVLPVQGRAVAELLASFAARYDRFHTSPFGFDSEMLTDCYRQLSFTGCV